MSAVTAKRPRKMVVKKPRYAIVLLSEDADFGHFYSLLMQEGLTEHISLVDDAKGAKLLGLAIPPDQLTQERHSLPPTSTSANSSDKGDDDEEEEEDVKPNVDELNAEMSNATQKRKQVQSARVTAITTAGSPIRPFDATSTPSKRFSSSADESARMEEMAAAGNGDSPSGHISTSALAHLAQTNRGRPLFIPKGQFVTCSLCRNRIMCSRFSNLTNHVKRHTRVKQYECCLCQYSHNEIAKVRLHMVSNHGDGETPARDNMSEELQRQWDQLLERCFPGFNPKTDVQPDTRLRDLRSRHPLPPAVYDACATEHGCMECGEVIKETMLPHHIIKKHRFECVPFQCGTCGYEAAQEWMVRSHIAMRHSNDTFPARLIPMAPGARPHLFIKKFFPQAPGPDHDFESDTVPDQSAETPVSAAGAEDDEDVKPSAEELKLEGQETGIEFDVDGAGGSNTAYPDDTGEDEDVAEGEEDPFRPIGLIECALCGRVLESASRGLTTLVAHAKRHYHLKQFRCGVCTYESSEAAHVRTHHIIKHHIKDSPIDMSNKDLQRAWIEVMKRCYPMLIERISVFRFKTKPVDKRSLPIWRLKASLPRGPAKTIERRSQK